MWIIRLLRVLQPVTFNSNKVAVQEEEDNALSILAKMASAQITISTKFEVIDEKNCRGDSNIMKNN